MSTDYKECCSAVYEHDWVRLLLGESFHPGGLALTERLGELLHVGPDSILLDAACGLGTSAVYLARVFGCRVIGVDLGARNIARGAESARVAGVEARVEFQVGDGEHLPLPDASVDAVLCECAFCLFHSKQRAASEFARVLRPGGSVGLSDLTRSGTLPVELDGLLARIACIADARPTQEYVQYLRDAGLSDLQVELQDAALSEMVTGIRGKLLGAELLLKLGKLSLPDVDLDAAKAMALSAEKAVREKLLGYALVIARKDEA